MPASPDRPGGVIGGAMAVYLPSAKIAVEIVDDPTSLPADLSAFPDFTIVPITSADLRSPAARDRTVKRIARMAANKPGTHATSDTHDQPAGTSTSMPRTASKRERKQLLDLINTGLDLTQGSATARVAV